MNIVLHILISKARHTMKMRELPEILLRRFGSNVKEETRYIGSHKKVLTADGPGGTFLLLEDEGLAGNTILNIFADREVYKNNDYPVFNVMIQGRSPAFHNGKLRYDYYEDKVYFSDIQSSSGFGPYSSEVLELACRILISALEIVRSIKPEIQQYYIQHKGGQHTATLV